MKQPEIVTEILKMQAEQKGCKVEDLQWKRDKWGNIHTRLRNACKNQKTQERKSTRFNSWWSKIKSYFTGKGQKAETIVKCH